MRRPLIALVLASFLTPTLAPTLALAQPKPAAHSVRDDLPQAARKDWDAANDLYDAQDFAGALVEFQRAYDLSKDPRVLFNIAVCQKNLRHYAKAIHAFKHELAEGGSKLDAKDTKEIEDAIALLEQYVSTLDVKSNEDSVQIFIDGDPAGKTPYDKPIEVDVGQHSVTARKDSFKEPAPQVVSVARGVPSSLTFKLEPETVKTIVTVTASGAQRASIWIDGTDMGPSPFKGEVTLGRHTFEARALGFNTASQTSEVSSRDPMNLVLALSEARHEGHVHVIAKPSGAMIEIDHKVVGTNEWEGVLSTGGHQLRITKAGYSDWSTDISIADDQTRTIDQELTQDKSRGVLFWGIGAAVVLAGGTLAAIAIFRPKNDQPVVGTFDPGLTTTHMAHW